MWYTIENVNELDSPCFVVYPDRVQENIKRLVQSIDDVARLRPHIKTHKSSEVSKLMLKAGITKFKCATIAEAEMLAETGAKDILLAYQPVGPKAKRLAELVSKYPGLQWSCLTDNVDAANEISSAFASKKLKINVYIDLNVGMNRTGIVPQKALALFEKIHQLPGLDVMGLHAYDGHQRDSDFSVRKQKTDTAFKDVENLHDDVQKKFNKRLTIVAGGTPTFSVHCQRKEVECSPGTYVYWDQGYEQILKEQHYLHAGLVVTRVVSLPADNIVCTDLGHKAIASENPITNRVSFLNASDLEPIGHSEEHMVFKTIGKYKVGDVLYGVPYHICPTVALHEIAHTVSDGKVTDGWITKARRRKLSV
jgi:D-serine deaminase-like pyridoxal phosphate-dependent protein